MTKVDNGTLTVDLSGADMSRCGALFLIMSAGAGSCTFSLAVNGTALVTLATIDHGVGAGVAWVIPYGTNYLGGRSNYCTSASYSSNVGSHGTCQVACYQPDYQREHLRGSYSDFVRCQGINR